MDEDCCDTKKHPICCPEDCPPVLCEDFNIYWFGSCFTDVGNGRCNLGLEPYSIKTLFSPCQEDIIVGYGPCARPSNGLVYPQFIAEDYSFELSLEYDLCELPKGKNNMVSFALTGSTQTQNNVPLTPAGKYGYDWQVNRFIDLYDRSECYSVPEKDLFMYTDVGLDDFFFLLRELEKNPGLDVSQWFTDNLVNPTVKNVQDLFSWGKARRMIVQLVDLDVITQLPLYSKLGCVSNDVLLAYGVAIQEIRVALLQFVDQQQFDLDLTVLFLSDLLNQVTLNPNAYGIVLGGTMIERGWPNKVFSDQLFFDDVHPSEHTHRVMANYVKTWFQQKLCP